MTNKEAINRIEEILEEVKLCGVEQGNKDIEALDLAIKALEFQDNVKEAYYSFSGFELNEYIREEVKKYEQQ